MFIVPGNDWCAERDRSAKVQKVESTLSLDKNLCLIPGLRGKRALPINTVKRLQIITEVDRKSGNSVQHLYL